MLQLYKNIKTDFLGVLFRDIRHQTKNLTIEPRILRTVPWLNPPFQFEFLELVKSLNVCFLVHHA